MPALPVEMVGPLIATGATARVEADSPTRFKTGDAIRARNMNPIGHTRLPRYIRGRSGTVVKDCGVFILPDTHAHGQGPCPERLYCVRFEGKELWGEQGGAHDAVYITLWDRYIDGGEQ